MKKTIDLEPPSSKQTTRLNLQNLKTKLFLYSTQFSKLRDLFSNFNERSRNTTKSFYNLISLVLNRRFLPHIAIVFILFIAVFTNIAQAKTEAALSQELVSVDYSSQFGITTSIDRYTPLINSDSTQLEKNLVARDSFDGFLIASSLVDTTLTVRTEPLPDNNKSGVVYIVREGDTLSKLASAFGLKIATIKYANDMTNDVIRPGSKLTISARGNNVSAVAIAKKEAQKLALANRNTVTRDQSKNRTILVSTYAGKRGSSINGYPYGWCTYYAASRRNIPSSWGNAGQWLRSANSHGWSTGKQPQAGAVVVTGESFMGHVAVVEKVEGGKIIISEMNGPAGFGVVGLRSIPLDSKKIKGYIY